MAIKVDHIADVSLADHFLEGEALVPRRRPRRGETARRVEIHAPLRQALCRCRSELVHEAEGQKAVRPSSRQPGRGGPCPVFYSWRPH